MVETRGIAARVLYRSGKTTDLEAISSIEAQSHLNAGTRLSALFGSGPQDTLSFVATLDDTDVIGHLLLTRMDQPDQTLALEPLAVLPQWRDMQIGTQLVRYALEQARMAGWRAVFVYGQPDYYRRFGFHSKLADGAQTDLQGPRLMALELVPGALTGWSGPITFPKALV
jgi:putative acetyltransferase